MARSNASNVTPIHASGILGAGAVAPNFTLHVTPDQTLTLRWGSNEFSHARNRTRIGQQPSLKPYKNECIRTEQGDYL